MDLFLYLAIPLSGLLVKLGLESDFRWYTILMIAAVPFVFTYLLGFYGFLVAGLFVGSMYKTFDK